MSFSLLQPVFEVWNPHSLRSRITQKLVPSHQFWKATKRWQRRTSGQLLDKTAWGSFDYRYNHLSAGLLCPPFKCPCTAKSQIEAPCLRNGLGRGVQTFWQEGHIISDPVGAKTKLIYISNLNMLTYMDLLRDGNDFKSVHTTQREEVCVQPLRHPHTILWRWEEHSLPVGWMEAHGGPPLVPGLVFGHPWLIVIF